jgi:hypothetical protein
MKTKKMKRIFALMSAALLSLMLIAVSAARAQEPERTSKPGENLQTAKILDVQAHPEGKPVQYIEEGSQIPLYDDYPFWDITLQVGDKKYTVRYDNMGGYYPSAWKPGSEVKVKIESGVAYIQRYDGVLVETPIQLTSPV